MCTHTHLPHPGAESHLFPRAQVFSATKSQPFDNYSPKPRKRLKNPENWSWHITKLCHPFNYTVICYYGKTVVNGWKDIKQQYRITKLFLHDLKGPILCFSDSAIAVIRYFGGNYGCHVKCSKSGLNPQLPTQVLLLKKIKLHKCKLVGLKLINLQIWQWIKRKYAKNAWWKITTTMTTDRTY